MTTELARSVSRLGERLERIPPFPFGVLVIALLLVRNGLHIFNTDWVGLNQAIDSLPVALHYNSWSWGNLLLARILGIETWGQWLALHGVLTFLAVTIPLVVLSRRNRDSFHLLAVFWVLLPAVGSLLLWIGMYDALTFIGVTILILGSRWWWALIGSVIMSSGNPEQAVVISLILLAASITPTLRRYRSRAYIASATALIGLGLSRVLIVGSVGIDRSEALRSPVIGLEQLILQWPSSVWGLNGVLWIVVIAALFVEKGWGKVPLLLAFCVMPLGALLVTGDWFRVYWFVSLGALLALGITMITRIDSVNFRRVSVVVGLAGLVLVPSQTGSFFFLYDALGSLLLRGN